MSLRLDPNPEDGARYLVFTRNGDCQMAVWDAEIECFCVGELGNRGPMEDYYGCVKLIEE